MAIRAHSRAFAWLVVGAFPVAAVSAQRAGMPAPGSGGLVTLIDAVGHQRAITVPAGWTGDRLVDGTSGVRTLDLRGRAPQPGFASVATTAQQPGFDSTLVVALRVVLAGSGALDELRWRPHPVRVISGLR